MRFVTNDLWYDARPDNIMVQQSFATIPDHQDTYGERRAAMEPLAAVCRHLLGEIIVLAGLQVALLGQVNDLADLLGSDWN
jgi:hypothetical protein